MSAEVLPESPDRPPFATYAQVAAYYHARKQHARRSNAVPDAGPGSYAARVAKNTWLCVAQDEFTDAPLQHTYTVRLHATDLLTFYPPPPFELAPDGLVKVSTGGWLTTTTLDRINTFLSPRILQLRRHCGVIEAYQITDPASSPRGARVLGPFGEGVSLDLFTAAPTAFGQDALDRAVAQVAENRRLECGIRKLVRQALPGVLPMLHWDETMTGADICPACVRKEWTREHLVAHIEQGVLNSMLLKRATTVVPTVRGLPGRADPDAPHTRLRAYLRQMVYQGPQVTLLNRSGRADWREWLTGTLPENELGVHHTEEFVGGPVRRQPRRPASSGFAQSPNLGTYTITYTLGTATPHVASTPPTT